MNTTTRKLTTKEIFNYINRKFKTIIIDDKSCYLKTKCQSCNEYESCSNTFSNEIFSSCIIQMIEFSIENKKKVIFIEKEGHIILSEDKINIIRKFIDIKNLIDKNNLQLLKRINSNQVNGCKTCKLEEVIKPQKIGDIFNKNLFSKDPMKYYLVIKSIKSFLIKNEDCNKCLNKKGKIDKLIDSIESIKLFNKIPMNDYLKNRKKRHFLDYLSPIQELKQFYEKEQNDYKPIASYKIMNSNLVHVNIFKDIDELEYLYEYKINLPISLELFNYIMKKLEQDLMHDDYFLSLIKLNKILNYIIDFIKQNIKNYIDLNNEMFFEDLATYIGFSILKWKKLFPLLIDNQIEEIFLDSIDGFVYLNHSKFQKCKTTISLTRDEINAIISRLRLETNKNLNHLFPSLKCVFKNKFFYIRMGIDVEPINYNKFSLDIRRLNKNIFNLIDLIRLKTLSLDMAAFLSYCMHLRYNVTIIGKTDSGKTTLLNSLDLTYPQYFRKIYVEDIIETVDQDLYSYHQLKFQVDEQFNKSRIITNILHRSPDVLILGEILTKEETNALFHCLSIGLNGIQTIHASSIDALIRRLRIHFEIDLSCFEDLGFLVLMKKFENGTRKIIKISELSVQGNETIKIKNLCEYNPKTETWSRINYESSTKIKKFLDNSKFTNEMLNKYINEVKTCLGNIISKKNQSKIYMAKKLNQIYIRFINYF
ncbi:MAG: ATPase, T2SS/T4P/T4SS family [Promethearchaeota archaeon]